ncbi:MAG: response regulator [bacterium]
MSPDLSHIEVEKKFIQKLFELAAMVMPKDLTYSDFTNALARIAQRIDPHKKIDTDENIEAKPETEFVRILMIDNVGFVMQRVKQQLSKQDFIIIETYNDLAKASEKIRRESFDFIIINILIPTEREGLLFLKEIKAILNERHSETKLIVTGESIRKELTLYLKEQGVKNIIERKPDWITKLVDTIAKESAEAVE